MNKTSKWCICCKNVKINMPNQKYCSNCSAFIRKIDDRDNLLRRQVKELKIRLCGVDDGLSARVDGFEL